MDLNVLFFPAPKPSYSIESMKEKLIWVPRREVQQEIQKPENNQKRVSKHHKTQSLNFFQDKSYKQQNTMCNSDINDENQSTYSTASQMSKENSKNINLKHQSLSSSNIKQNGLYNQIYSARLNTYKNSNTISSNNNAGFQSQQNSAVKQPNPGNFLSARCDKKFSEIYKSPDQYTSTLSTRLKFQTIPQLNSGGKKLDSVRKKFQLKNKSYKLNQTEEQQSQQQQQQQKSETILQSQDNLENVESSLNLSNLSHYSMNQSNQSSLSHNLLSDSDMSVSGGNVRINATQNQIPNKNEQFCKNSASVNSGVQLKSPLMKSQVSDGGNSQKSFTSPINHLKNMQKNTFFSQKPFANHSQSMSSNQLDFKKKCPNLNLSQLSMGDIEETQNQYMMTSPGQIKGYKTRVFSKNCFQKGILQTEFDEFEDKEYNHLKTQSIDSYQFAKPSLMRSINDINGTLCSPRYHKYFNQNSIIDANLEYQNISQKNLNMIKKGQFNDKKTQQQQQRPSQVNILTSKNYKISGFIPCMYLKAPNDTPYILVYFHGNGEDIKQSYDLLDHLRISLNINILAMEYPGYGVYKGEPSDTWIQNDAESVYAFLIQELKLVPKQIILLGRSIGSGSATYLASKYKVGALVLISAFVSLRGVVEHLVGRVASYLVKERFNNLDRIKQVQAPVFLLHGKIDKLVPYSHSLKLMESCKSIKQINLPENMSHTEFDFTDDLALPVFNFLSDNEIDLDVRYLDPKLVCIRKLPVWVYKVPNEFKKK